MDKDYYKQYYFLERNHWWFRARSKILSQFIQQKIGPTYPLKILNVGIATGASTEMLSKFGTVTSIEYDEDCCKFVNDVLGIAVQQGSILDLQFADNTFDMVCAFDVLEHVEDDKKGAAELTRVCREGGYVFVTVPAYQFLWSEHDEVNHHYRRYTATGLKKIFGQYQLRKISLTYFNSILFLPIAILRLILRWDRKKNKADYSRKSDFEKIKINFLNNILYRIFIFEKGLLALISFKFGISILFLGKKNSAEISST